MGDEELKRKRGRPKKDGSKYERVEIRLTTDMANRLNNLSDLVGMSKADILRDAFNRYEQLRLLQLPDEHDEEYFDDDFDDFGR